MSCSDCTGNDHFWCYDTQAALSQRTFCSQTDNSNFVLQSIPVRRGCHADPFDSSVSCRPCLRNRFDWLQWFAHASVYAAPVKLPALTGAELQRTARRQKATATCTGGIIQTISPRQTLPSVTASCEYSRLCLNLSVIAVLGSPMEEQLVKAHAVAIYRDARRQSAVKALLCWAQAIQSLGYT